jgi:hypothetical protein
MRALRRMEQIEIKKAGFVTVQNPFPVPQITSTGKPAFRVDECFSFRDIWGLVEDIFKDDAILRSCVWRYSPKFQFSEEPESRLFGDLMSSNWARDTERELRHDVLAIILNVDDTRLHSIGGECTPVYMTIGNAAIEWRNTWRGKRLLGFIPTVNNVRKGITSDAVATYKRILHNWCLRVMLDPVVNHQHGKLLKVGPEVKFLVPRVPMFVTDHMEGQKLCQMFLPSSTNRPCRHCLIQPAKDSRGIFSTSTPRTQQHMKSIIELHPEQTPSYSIFPEKNLLFDIPGLDLFMLPPCRMHSTDEGVYCYVNKLCRISVAKAKQLSTFDSRWGSLSSFPGQRAFYSGETSRVLTAGELRTQALGLPFALHGLGSPNAEKLAIAYCRWRQLLGQRELSIPDIEQLHIYGQQLQSAFEVMWEEIGEKSVGKKSIKLHMIQV